MTRRPGARPRGLLVVNPAAHRFDERKRERALDALHEGLDLDHVQTKARGHAGELAAGAVEEGMDIVLVLGGDGTVNEAANALAGSTTALGILPGGEANVLARSLGIPTDPVAAAARAAALALQPRPFPLGRLGDRYFTCNCGVGFDAAIVREVESRPGAKRRFGDFFFLWTGLRLFFGGGYDRDRAPLEVIGDRGPDDRITGLHLAIVQNLSPYTFFGPRPLRICPDAALGTGLHLLGVDSMSARVVLPVLLSAFGRARHADRPHVRYLPGRHGFTLNCEVPLPVQVDGEYLGERTEVTVGSVPGALRIVY